MTDIELAKQAQTAIREIGKVVADHRPDLNEQLDDQAIIEASIYTLYAMLCQDMSVAKIIEEAFAAALYTQKQRAAREDE